MKLVVTIDVEEDQWGAAPFDCATTTNVQQIFALQDIFNDYHVVPMYLLTYPVAADSRAVAVLRHLLDQGRCEIGMHCHPWNTPPYVETINRRNSMLCNLPASVQREKLQRLHELITKRFDRPPVAFRSGRWGYGRETAQVLVELECRIDTSITPYTSWTRSDGPDFSSYSPHPFAFRATVSSTDDLVEVPVTIGYVGGTFAQCHRLSHWLREPPFRRLRVAGFLARLELLRSVWLSPERETSARMAKLIRQSMREGSPLVNLFFHSSALQIGCTPFVNSQKDKLRFLQRLRAVLEFCRGSGITPISLSQVAETVVRETESVDGGIALGELALSACLKRELPPIHSRIRSGE